MGFFKSLKHVLAPHTAYHDQKKEASQDKVKIAEMRASTEIKLAKMEHEQAERDAQREIDARRAEQLANANSSLQDLEGGF